MTAFSEFIKHVGRGEKGRRPLTQEEAKEALGMYLDGKAKRLQLATLLMLQRVRCETNEEAAGYIQALRERISPQWQALDVDVDWPCFAGKRRQPPYLLLAAKLLAQNGIRIMLSGHLAVDAIKYQIESACPDLGIRQASTPEEASQILGKDNICYIPLSAYCEPLIELLALRDLVGLRTPLNTVARALNPTAAPFAIHGIFHQGYEQLHAEAAQLVGDRNMVALKGEGGESERNPRTACRVAGVQQGQLFNEEWPTYLEGASGKHGEISGTFLQQLWLGEVENNYGKHAVISTAALILKLMGVCPDQAAALEQAGHWWEHRLA
ncbi:glycosyl transferase family protein [Photobacterium sanctipauli]|uniref:Glycosyl transferase family protein n=1 Tax=Photobacterium sanctipauli TaxID=1342794 RepID=A0A2T3NP15_9GAMM|nr:glycosyl transferase family protein [Photobacterium sanctipauli]PSW18015.1 glycosyl transferase family protein [Photobacterium sanctipauli]